mgnify:CR=1 FL=1
MLHKLGLVQIQFQLGPPEFSAFFLFLLILLPSALQLCAAVHARDEIMDVVTKYPEYADEIQGMVDRYEKMY